MNSKLKFLALSFITSFLLIITYFSLQPEKVEKLDYVTIAILAKDKAHTLPLYLSCIDKQTFPKERSYLYIRTNNNNDNTAEVLKNWIEKVGHLYAGIYFDDSDVTELVQNFKQHEWNAIRFKVLGKIRQDSLDYAREHNSHYFVADCDNFVHPQTIANLLETNLPIVAPLLRVAEGSSYSNYHAEIDQNGYFANSPYYYDILTQKLKGLIALPVVHCTYLVRQEIADKISYDDNSYRYEYVIFSDSARKQNIGQYLDNREIYGRITFAETQEDFLKEPWLYEFLDPKEKMTSIFTSIYKNCTWGKNEEGEGCSGYGSTASSTTTYRDFLQKFIVDNQLEKVVDIGCGDWEFSRLMDWSFIKQYIGYDVVQDVISANQAKYGQENIQFVSDNFLFANLPEADLLICKDVLQHLSNQDILEFLPKLSKFKYCLITNDIELNNQLVNNTDIVQGDYRPLDLTKPPFNLEAEKVLEFIPGNARPKQVLLLKNKSA